MKSEIDIKQLQQNIIDLVKELNEEFDDNNKLTESKKFILKQKYNYIELCSSTLFELILSNFTKKEFLTKHITVLLENLNNVQKNRLSEYDASVNVGEHFAKEYFPKK